MFRRFEKCCRFKFVLWIFLLKEVRAESSIVSASSSGGNQHVNTSPTKELFLRHNCYFLFLGSYAKNLRRCYFLSGRPSKNITAIINKPYQTE